MATSCRVQCPIDGEQIVGITDIVIDDEHLVYRFTCPSCATVAEKDCDAQIRHILRTAGCPTLDELVASGAAALNDDAAIWRGLLA